MQSTSILKMDLRITLVSYKTFLVSCLLNHVYIKCCSGTIGAIDGTHINLKVPSAQHDSYIDRYMQHSINLLGICTSEKIFTYIFIGFPGAAHDSRVFSNSSLYKEVDTYGSSNLFPNDCHLIGDSAFPLKHWIMTPYKGTNLNRMKKYHNYMLSKDRVAIENVFGLVKGRWRRLFFINVYSIAKAIEIATAACILHNFCYLNKDDWEQLPFLKQKTKITMKTLREVGRRSEITL